MEAKTLAVGDGDSMHRQREKQRCHQPVEMRAGEARRDLRTSVFLASRQRYRGGSDRTLRGRRYGQDHEEADRSRPTRARKKSRRSGAAKFASSVHEEG